MNNIDNTGIESFINNEANVKQECFINNENKICENINDEMIDNSNLSIGDQNINININDEISDKNNLIPKTSKLEHSPQLNNNMMLKLSSLTTESTTDCSDEK